MKNELIPASAIREFKDEPCILDIELAARLGMARATNIRAMIASNRDELEAYGGLHVANANPGNSGGRPGKAYYLNEGQALVICALSRTEKAAQVRKMLVDVFTAYRQGKLVHVKEHRRRLPRVGKGTVDYEEYFKGMLDCVRASNVNPDEMLASVITRLMLIEQALGGR